MLIVCPNCQTSYDVASTSLGDAGRSVRCVRCRETWFATPAAEPALADGMVSPAAASAQYQKGAVGARDEPPPSEAWGDDLPPEDEVSVDPNLAARAAQRLSGALDDLPPLDADAHADGMDQDSTLTAHDAPPLAPHAAEDAGHAETIAGEAGPGEDIESVAARRARRQAQHGARRGLRPSLSTVIMLLVAVNAALLGWRSDVVRIMPQTASLYAAIGLPVNLRGLAFSDVVTTKEVHDGVAVLLVQGTIANVSRQPLDVPRIRFAMRNAGGAEVYSWTTLPGRTVLAPGDAQPFHSRLASPPTEGREVSVRFFNRRDAVAGIR